MKKREKILAWVIAGLIGVFVIDQVVVSRVIETFDAIEQERAAVEQKLIEARVLVNNQRAINQKCDAYAASALPGNDPDAALQLITQWALDAGMSVQVYTSGRQIEGERFDRKVFTFSATGKMQSVEGFLWSLRTAEIPLRIETCTLNSRDENKDELALTLMLTTILEPTANNAAANSPGGGR